MLVFDRGATAPQPTGDVACASDDSVVDKIDSLLASATESSEGTRKGRSIAKSDPKIAPCFYKTQNGHVLSVKFRGSHQGAISGVLFVKVNHDQDMTFHRSLIDSGFTNRHRNMKIRIVFAVKLIQDLRDPLQEQVVS